MAFSKRASRAKKRNLPEAVPAQGSPQAHPLHPPERPTTYQPGTLQPSAACGPHILLNCEYARLIRSLFRRAALSSSLLVPVENIILLSGRPAINTISSSRATIKKKEPPKDDSPNRRRSSAPISASLFRYYSASPNASVIRIDLLDLTIADAGITIDLDKDWHSDLYVKCDTKH